MSIGIGVIGAGVMGADHVRITATEVAGARVVAVCDQDLARAKSVAAGAPGARALSDPMALIADKGVDAILVASPDETHAEYALACIAAGKPVLCEKPLAPTAEACQRIIAAEQAGGKRLVQVGYMRRFDPSYMDIKNHFSSGDFGEALLLHCVHRNATVPPWFTSLMSITNALVHEFDIIRWLLDREIASIQVLQGRSTHHSKSPDPLFAVMEMDDGMLVDAEVFMNSSYGYDVRTELVCEKGTLTMTPPNLAELRSNGAQSFPFAKDWRARFETAYRRQMQAFVESVSTGRMAGSSAWDGLAASAVAEAGMQAFRTKSKMDVTLPKRPKLYA